MRYTTALGKFALIAFLVALNSSRVEASDEFGGAKKCFVCHNNMPTAASVHDEKMAGNENHCETCHGPSKAHAQRQSGGPWKLPPVRFGGQVEVTSKNAMCLDCHFDAMKSLGPPAQSFHAAAERNGLGCNRCHGGVAHGLPAWVVELSQMQKENENP